eukprot:tig00021517_g21981.t1
MDPAERAVIALSDGGDVLYAASLQSETAAWIYRPSRGTDLQSPAVQLEVRRHATVDGIVWSALHSAVADGFLAAPTPDGPEDMCFLHQDDFASEDSALWHIESADGATTLVNKAGSVRLRVKVRALPKRDALYDLEGPAPHISAELEKQYLIEPLPPPEGAEAGDAQAEEAAEEEANNAEWLSRWLHDDEALLSSVRPLTTEEALARAEPSIVKTLSSRLLQAPSESKAAADDSAAAAEAKAAKGEGAEGAAPSSSSSSSSPSTAALPAGTAAAVEQVQRFLRELREYDELVLELGHLEQIKLLPRPPVPLSSSSHPSSAPPVHPSPRSNSRPACPSPLIRIKFDPFSEIESAQVEHGKTRELAALKAAYADSVGEVDVLQRDIAAAKMEMEARLLPKMEMELAAAAHAPDEEVLPATVITHLYALGGRSKGGPSEEKQSDEDFIREERERHFHELREMEEVAEAKHQVPAPARPGPRPPSS